MHDKKMLNNHFKLQRKHLPIYIGVNFQL